MNTKRKAGTPPVQYRVEVADAHAHLFRVTMVLRAPVEKQQVQLPVWIPGSYLVREFSKHLQRLHASQGATAVSITQLDKASWRLDCTPGAPLKLEYEIYAFDASVRTAWLDTQRGFFNGTSLFLRAQEFATQPHGLEVVLPPQTPHWKAATALTPVRTDKRGFGFYEAVDYDTLVDCPVELGNFWSGDFVAGGIPHRFVVAGGTDSFDGARLLEDTQAICAQQLQFWHGKNRTLPPIKHYLFLLNAVHDGYGGLEHRSCTALMCNRKDLPRQPLKQPALAPTNQSDGYTTLLGLISHEYFHTWNVKRLRPVEYTRYDFRGENYTNLLWFFEGFTSYYDDLLLRRSKRIDNATYLKLLTKAINQLQQTPGRLVQTVAQASFDAWVKYYRQDENTVNATVSYYTKGALVALCLDLTLRSEGHTTLDTVMQTLWEHCQGGPMKEHDLLHVLEVLAKRSFAKELKRWVHSTAELPLAQLLEAHGVQYNREPDQLPQQLGLRVKDGAGVVIHQVLQGGAAHKAGFASGDEWVAVQSAKRNASGPWRMQSLDDLMLYCGNSTAVTATVARDKRLLTLDLALPKPTQAVRLSVRDAAAVNQWLN